METEITTYGLLLRKLRECKGLTKEKLGKCLDVSPSYISKIENEGRIPSKKCIQNIAKVLGIPYLSIVGSAIQDKIFSYRIKLEKKYGLITYSLGDTEYNLRNEIKH